MDKNQGHFEQRQGCPPQPHLGRCSCQARYSDDGHWYATNFTVSRCVVRRQRIRLV